MKRRITLVAMLVVLADVLLMGAAWHAGPVLSLTAALASPDVEPILAPLYAEPLREDVAIDGAGVPLRAALYRPTQAHRSLVLVRDTSRDDDAVASLARLLARRGLLVVVPGSAPADLAALDAYVTAVPAPVDVTRVSSFDEDGSARSFLTRVAHAWRLLRLSHALLTTP